MSRVLSVHQEHELLLKLESAGLDTWDARRIIECKDNVLGKMMVRTVKAGDNQNEVELAGRLADGLHQHFNLSSPSASPMEFWTDFQILGVTNMMTGDVYMLPVITMTDLRSAIRH